MTPTGQALHLAGDTPRSPAVPDDPAAISMFTAHRLDDMLRSLAYAAERMKAARTAPAGLRGYHSQHIAAHLGRALTAGHDLTVNLREHYPAEAAELEQVRQAIGLAAGYALSPRSGMISLDLPPGTLPAVPGGVDDHHITVVYLGKNVDDEAYAQACDRARQAAAAIPGPLTGMVGGIGTFPASDGDGKTPVWAGVLIPGTERLRSALEDLSASEHADWKPHVTLAYLTPGEPLPDPVPPVQVEMTHLSVHRGDDEVARFPLGGGTPELAATAGDGTVALAKSLTPGIKAATTAHLLETTLHEMTHGVRHARQMLTADPAPAWEFNADHCQKHLGGALEHASKLVQHFRDNYPGVSKWLGGLEQLAAGGGPGGGNQHARYGKRDAAMAGTISGQVADLALARDARIGAGAGEAVPARRRPGADSRYGS